MFELRHVCYSFYSNSIILKTTGAKLVPKYLSNNRINQAIVLYTIEILIDDYNTIGHSD